MRDKLRTASDKFEDWMYDASLFELLIFWIVFIGAIVAAFIGLGFLLSPDNGKCLSWHTETKINYITVNNVVTSQPVSVNVCDVWENAYSK